MGDVDMVGDRPDGSLSPQQRAMSSHDRGHGENGTVAEYWKQHGALKASYQDEINAMYNAFRARISQDSSVDDAIAAEKRQVEFDMESVTFCKVVLDESASTQSTPRTWDDLARVRKYIQMVVVPYMAKMAPPVVAPSDPAPASDIQTNVHVAWAGRRHNSSRGGRPAIDRSVGGVPASYMNHASAAPSAASSPVATSSQVSIQSEDVEASSGGENNANAVEYWRQHAALKAAHYETCKVVYHAFQHFLVTSSADQDASQRQKLTYLLGFVEFCCHVLSESSATHPARPISDLKRVVKSVNKIMLPYRHKIGMAEKAAHATAHGSLQVDGGAIHEAPTMMMAAATKSPMSIASTSSTASRTTVLPSVQNLLQRSSTRDNAPGTTYAQLDRRSDPAADQYWHHKSQLEATYLRQVMAAQTFFDAYRHKFATQRSQEHLQDVVHLCDYADYCRQVLSEDRQAASQRSLQELHVVHSYITALVLPHLASLQALVDRDNSTAPAIPPTDDCHRMSRLHQHTDSFLQAMDQPKPAVDKEGSRGSSGAVVGMSDPASTYWRKHAALRELYRDNVMLVQAAFQKYAAEFAHAKSAAEARKLTRLYDMLEHVEFSAKVFNELPGKDAPRDLDTLDIVHRCIMQIVSPYCQHVEAEARS